MKKSLQISIITLVIFLVFQNSAYSQQKIVGYYTSWSNLPEINKIEFNNLTHIIHAFAFPDTDGSISLSDGVPNSALVTAVHNAKKKILISFFNDSTDGFGKVLADSSVRSIFISNVVKFLLTNHYDGIDIDWEYPTAKQSGQLTELVKELRQSFNLTDTTWLISMAVPPTPYYGQYYNCEDMLPYIDWYSILAYNYHGSWFNHSGHNAPLYESGNDIDGNVAGAVQYLNITRKIPASKLLLGVAFYGMEFNSKGLYQPRTGAVPTVTYSDVINTVASGNWNYNWDSVAEVPYYINSDSTKFISFDDTVSVRLKTEFSISKKLGGIMIWALDQDLVNNSQPLLEAIGQAFRNDSLTAVVADERNNIPSSFYLYNNYPNPFNPSTTISWKLAAGSFVTLKVYDILGNEVATLINEFQKTGAHSITFNTQQAGGKYLASGVYLYRLIAGGYVSTKKMMYLK